MTPLQIQNIAADYFHISVADLKSHRRSVALTRQRWLTIDLTREYYPRMSLTELGLHFGGRDHNTITNAIVRLNEEIPLYHDLARHQTVLRQRLEQATIQPS